MGKNKKIIGFYISIVDKNKPDAVSLLNTMHQSYSKKIKNGLYLKLKKEYREVTGVSGKFKIKFVQAVDFGFGSFGLSVHAKVPIKYVEILMNLNDVFNIWEIIESKTLAPEDLSNLNTNDVKKSLTNLEGIKFVSLFLVKLGSIETYRDLDKNYIKDYYVDFTVGSFKFSEAKILGISLATSNISSNTLSSEPLTVEAIIFVAINRECKNNIDLIVDDAPAGLLMKKSLASEDKRISKVHKIVSYV